MWALLWGNDQELSPKEFLQTEHPSTLQALQPGKIKEA